jgi:hypothetical protein
MRRAVWLCGLWPQRDASAAGIHTYNMLEAFRRAEFELHFLSAEKPNRYFDELAQSGFNPTRIMPSGNDFEETLKKLDAQVVVFDRFVLEEQFGWRVRAALPRCMRIVDTQDLHFLRGFRTAYHEKLISAKSNDANESSELLPLDHLRALWDPSHMHYELFAAQRDELHREVASILRSDVSLIISSYEVELLTNLFAIDSNKLHLTPFDYESPTATRPFDERKVFHFFSFFVFHFSFDRSIVRSENRVGFCDDWKFPSCAKHARSCVVQTSRVASNSNAAFECSNRCVRRISRSHFDGTTRTRQWIQYERSRTHCHRDIAQVQVSLLFFAFSLTNSKSEHCAVACRRWNQRQDR